MSDPLTHPPFGGGFDKFEELERARCVYLALSEERDQARRVYFDLVAEYVTDTPDEASARWAFICAIAEVDEPDPSAPTRYTSVPHHRRPRPHTHPQSRRSRP